MRASSIPVALAAAAGVAACAGHGDEAAVSVPLVATPRNAGEIGRAFLIPRGPSTEVVVEVSGVPPQLASRPVRLYTLLYDGPCDRLPPQPAHALTERVLARSGRATVAGGPFTVSNSVALSLDALRRARYAIVIRTSPADGDVEIFCGTVG